MERVSTPDETAVQFAWALCKHEMECSGAKVNDRVRNEMEAACIADLKAPARMNVGAWDCAPGVARAGFKECLATIARDGCIMRRADDRLPLACRPAVICRTAAL